MILTFSHGRRHGWLATGWACLVLVAQLGCVSREPTIATDTEIQFPDGQGHANAVAFFLSETDLQAQVDAGRLTREKILEVVIKEAAQKLPSDQLSIIDIAGGIVLGGTSRVIVTADHVLQALRWSGGSGFKLKYLCLWFNQDLSKPRCELFSALTTYGFTDRQGADPAEYEDVAVITWSKPFSQEGLIDLSNVMIARDDPAEGQALQVSGTRVNEQLSLHVQNHFATTAKTLNVSRVPDKGQDILFFNEYTYPTPIIFTEGDESLYWATFNPPYVLWTQPGDSGGPLLSFEGGDVILRGVLSGGSVDPLWALVDFPGLQDELRNWATTQDDIANVDEYVDAVSNTTVDWINDDGKSYDGYYDHDPKTADYISGLLPKYQAHPASAHDVVAVVDQFAKISQNGFAQESLQETAGQWLCRLLQDTEPLVNHDCQ